MAVILITSHDEHIRDLCKEPTPLPKLKLYKTKYHKDEGKVQKKAHATMGIPLTELPDPQNYLKKHTGKSCYGAKDIIKKEPTPPVRQKIEVPKTAECLKAEKPPRPCKNYILDNINTICKMKPNPPIPTVVIDRFGNKVLAKPGLRPADIKTFGKYPPYLWRILYKQQINYLINKYKQSEAKQRPGKYIPCFEKDKMINGLIQNYYEILEQHERIPLSSDSYMCNQRKAKMQAELKQLEEDIVLLERNHYLFVPDDVEINS
ncbi:enkurin-like [Diorhabda carinulata]|uniref:enkurin-like n=1 Tax=Diorhabda sublineata TaxID=1163346 RepID=UPI0024E169F2|nr:enkurin-like [Diorhabda sublineata]XP_057666248.1 enkurin-like [Diorhabda carinulata]